MNITQSIENGFKNANAVLEVANNTKYFKGSNGREAETSLKIDIEEGVNYVLEISTRKSMNGSMVTRASVCIVEDKGDWISKTFQPFSDFNKSYRVTALRCTAKNVKEQHESVLHNSLDDIKKEKY